MGFLSKLKGFAPKAGGADMGASTGKAKGKGIGGIGAMLLTSKMNKQATPDATKKPKARGPVGKLLEVSMAKEKMFKKGGTVKKSSDAAGRAMGRKTADAKGRAMKKGK